MRERWVGREMRERAHDDFYFSSTAAGALHLDVVYGINTVGYFNYFYFRETSA